MKGMFDRGGLECILMDYAVLFPVGACVAEIAQVFAKVLDNAGMVLVSQWYIFVRAVSTDSLRDVLGSGRGLFLPISQSLQCIYCKQRMRLHKES